ncbi:ABC transporter substrate-binding protein [Butyrivibrio sp. AE3004]|uniref:ABC transporter substrate-binding protein n=1 Tax=Butyrivibrio sp. AE3004 TaxID=1506994 RepID=UPI0006892613|nr:ABC transporter substrate-binding protein [Butyrivibrio sp. AE3004]
MKKRLVAIMMGCMLALSAIGCGADKTADTKAESTESVSEESASEEAAADTDAENNAVEDKEPESNENEVAGAENGDAEVAGTVSTDRSGNEITVPETVERIVSMAPSTTGILIDLGLADKIVACDTNSFASYGSELKADIPQFDMMTPDQEQIIALKADIIFTSGMSASQGIDVFETVRETGVCIADIPSSASLNDIEKDITFIGQCVGEVDAAQAIADDMQRKIDELSEIGNSISEDEKKNVLFELFTPSADNPIIYTAGNGTYINEMLETIGAKNVAASEAEQWPALSEEAAVAANPDVILTADMYTPDVINTILNTTGWENVTAIKNSEVYQLSSDAVNQPNQHVMDVMLEMAKYIYPEKYENVALNGAE